MILKKDNQVNRNKLFKRIFLVLLSFLVILSSGIFPGNTEAEVNSRGPNLKQVGPINESNGFPLWYKDSNNVKLELCLDPKNTLCGLVPEDFDADKPIVFPDNYPGEAFYQLAEAAMESPDGRSDAIAVFALEATFNMEVPEENQQTVFGRIRFRVDSLTNGATYTITHPYGVDKIIATDGEINYTEDIGAGQGFDGALKSRIGTFLRWDQGAPEGYVGDPGIEHRVTGGVNAQNFFRIEGPGIGRIYSGFACPGNPDNCIQTDLFSLAGKESTITGLDIQQATYSQTADGGAIDVFVYSEDEQNIEVSGDGIANTTLAGGNGQYFTHVPYTGSEPPTEVTLTNTTDNPKTVKTIKPVDRITATANYNTESKTLTVTAKSSDQVNPTTLKVKGFRDIPETGTLVVSDLSYISPTITITSTKGGTVTVPVSINKLLVAYAGLDQTVKQGTVVTLDGSKSENAVSYSWKQVDGKTVSKLTGEKTASPTFTFPKQPHPVTFELTVTGPDGTTATDRVEISTVPDNLESTRAEYRSDDGSWRVEGRSDVSGPGVLITITVDSTGKRLGTATVDNSGNWRFRYANTGVAISDGTLTIKSSSGGELTGVPVEIR